MIRKAKVLNEHDKRRLFDDLCKLHGLPPYEGSNPCKDDGLFEKSINKQLANVGIRMDEAEVMVGFQSYRALCEKQRKFVLEHREAMYPTNYVQVREGKSKEDGGCNFCTVHDGEGTKTYRVWVVSSDDPHRNMSVRFCDDCLVALKQSPIVKAVKQGV